MLSVRVQVAARKWKGVIFLQKDDIQDHKRRFIQGHHSLRYVPCEDVAFR